MAPVRSSAWAFALGFFALIVYASLHPFEWRWQEPPNGWLELFTLPLPRLISRFDVVSNVVAYLPLGALLTAAQLREGRPVTRSAVLAFGVGALLSYSMEVLQHGMPTRVPSMLDWIANAGGTAAGVLLTCYVERVGGWVRWERLRERWVPHGQGVGMMLLLLWPVGLLFPPSLPFGLGQSVLRLRSAFAQWLEGTAWDGWLPADPLPPMRALAPGVELLGIACGLLAPCLLAFALTRPGPRRLVLLVGALLLALAATTLSTALNFGPEHALAWWTPPVAPGMALAAVVAAALAWLPGRAAAAVALPVIATGVALVNLAPADPYYAASLLGWEQGRFIRFHGLSQWVGWIWPYAAIVYLLTRLASRPRPAPAG
ncbi:VanZ family protein [Caldimonas sp. KR1-144]|uniref:VanZ family protein n=1 Tax=Caldimonas sp. KR1-144 TaxID=3400911 RepID=UPI003BFA8B0E